LGVLRIDVNLGGKATKLDFLIELLMEHAEAMAKEMDNPKAASILTRNNLDQFKWTIEYGLKEGPENEYVHRRYLNCHSGFQLEKMQKRRQKVRTILETCDLDWRA